MNTTKKILKKPFRKSLILCEKKDVKSTEKYDECISLPDFQLEMYLMINMVTNLISMMGPVDQIDE